MKIVLVGMHLVGEKRVNRRPHDIATTKRNPDLFSIIKWILENIGSGYLGIIQLKIGNKLHLVSCPEKASCLQLQIRVGEQCTDFKPINLLI